jgi:hypothetical protein
MGSNIYFFEDSPTHLAKLVSMQYAFSFFFSNHAGEHMPLVIYKALHL